MTIQEMHPKVKEIVYEHVFNKMPIRVLAFDSNGGQLQLIERNTIAYQILSRICVQYTWTNADNTPPLEHVQQTVEDIARYSILSHTWIKDTPGDVIYGDWGKPDILQSKTQGYSKALNFCKVSAREYGVLFGWMDNICIDKSSSTELDESIRSMYRWYQQAYICLTYLAETVDIDQMYKDPWFTRGWTLQELLAPRYIKFYDKNWTLFSPPSDDAATAIGNPAFDTKLSEYATRLLRISRKENYEVQIALRHQIWKATTITQNEFLLFQSNARRIPISRTMQLAATRKVTREEDRVYSLMGLLGVGIPIAYGEGEATAFPRLLREIMITRPSFLDLFNHGNKWAYVPRTISDYMDRNPIFDGLIHGKTALHLEHMKPSEPIVWTHIGVHVSLLCVPAFRKDVYENDIPAECETLTTRVHGRVGQPQDYISLDNSASSAEWISSLSIESANRASHDVIFFAMLNFQSDTDWIRVPFMGLATPVYPGEYETPCGINGINGKDVDQIGRPMVVILPFSMPENSLESNYELSHSEAKSLGIRIVTSYRK